MAGVRTLALHLLVGQHDPATPRRMGTTLTAVSADTSTRLEPPVAERRIHRRVHHGDVFDDPYEWLRNKEDPDVVGYLEAENALHAGPDRGSE